MNWLRSKIRAAKIDVFRFTEGQLIQYVGFLLIPLLFWAAAGFVIYDSISEYALHIPLVFALTLGWVAKLFIQNGYVSIGRKQWFELIIGWAMVGLIVFDMEGNTKIPHYIFATIFFEGSVFNMIYYSSGRYRIFAILFGLFLNFAMAGCFIWGWYSIFWAEWIGMLPISVHKSLETLGIID
ncbi:MAG: Unknown protein [uncultured Sulfurovum sp.]|uniref:Uncharacterized protein n=1 Tax=uncultured Sulfurovum sp. TaxID=269237 RepID=A0A6S6T1A0_9BACT|nr:MAG: Unknown protein [uncultured Sulfurovum sp.]